MIHKKQTVIESIMNIINKTCVHQLSYTKKYNFEQIFMCHLANKGISSSILKYLELTVL